MADHPGRTSRPVREACRAITIDCGPLRGACRTCPPSHRRNRAYGSLQLGWVVSVDGQHRDAQQRIAVQMEWLYQGEGGRPSRRWLPVSAHLSAQAINGLRAGVQVCVSYTEGDPDQPLISGVLVTPQQTGVDRLLATRLRHRVMRWYNCRSVRRHSWGASNSFKCRPGRRRFVGPGAERQFKVSCSEVSIVGETLHLSSPNLHLEPWRHPWLRPRLQPEEVPAVAAQDLLALLRSSQPLVLLCLPGVAATAITASPSACVARRQAMA